MKILIDDNNILSIENPNIQQTKQYSYNVSGFSFSDYNKWIIVYHKKQFKIINLKDLGDKMWIILVWEHDDEYDNMKLDLQSMESVLKLFAWFDEDTGQKYYFLYKFGENKMNELNSKLQKLWSKMVWQKTEKWITTPYIDDEPVYNPISFLFGLVLVYGTFQIKDWDLRAIKAQIPLFGQFVENQDIIQESIDVLSENGIYINKNIQHSDDGIIIELTSSDFELLEFFANFYEPIEKWLKINKIKELEQVKDELIEFIKTNPEIPSEWKDEVLKTLGKGIIKIMVK